MRGPCQAGNYNICAQIGFHGLMSDGGMAEYTVVPVNMLHKLPDNVSLGTRRAGGAHVGGLSRGHPGRCCTPATPRWCSARAPSASDCGSHCAARVSKDTFVVEPSATRRAAIESARRAHPGSDRRSMYRLHRRPQRAAGVPARYTTPPGWPPPLARALACVGARKANGQRGDLREAADHPAAEPGDERIPDPGLAVLHRSRFRSRHRPDVCAGPTTPPK